MKITLIDLPGVIKGFNTGLAYIGAVLKKENHEVKVIDLNNNRKNIPQRLQNIKSDVIGISVKSSTIIFLNEILNYLPNDKFIFCGGPHITIDSINFMNQFKKVNLSILGEGEIIVPKLIKLLESGKNFEKLPNIVYRKFNNLISNSFSKEFYIENLDEIPFPDYTIFDSFKGQLNNYPLLTSRGCPYNCIFCCVKEISGKKWRFRSVDNIIKELILAKELYKIKSFYILDDNFSFNIDRAKKFCEKLISKNLKFSWECPNGIRADKFDYDLANIMSKSGCQAVNIGVETLDKALFKTIYKGETLDDIYNAINNAKKVGIKTTGFFIIGLPNATFRKDMFSIVNAKKIGLDDAFFNLVSIYPKTKLWEIVNLNKNFTILKPWYKSFHFGVEASPVFESDIYKKGEIMKSYYLGNLKFNHYLVIAGETGSIFKRTIFILKIILKYDKKNLFYHFIFVLRNLKKVFEKLKSKV